MKNFTGLQKIETESELLAWIKTRRRAERDRLRVSWRDWLNNIAVFHNRNDLKLSDNMRLISSRISPEDEKRLNRIGVNFVQPHVRTLAAKSQRGNPILSCLPSTSEERDVLSAKVGDRLLQNEWYQQRMDQRRLEMSVWMGATGNAFFHTFFNRDLGALSHGVHIGEIETVCVSPFKVCVEPFRSSIDKCRWAIVDEVMPLDEIYAKYGDEYKRRTGIELQIGTGSTSGEQKSDSSSQMLTTLGLPDHENYESTEFGLASFIYHLPSARFPKGLYAIVCDEKILYVGDYPLVDSEGNSFDTLPIFHFKEILAPWRFMGESSATIVRQHQSVYEDLRNIERATLIRHAKPKLLVAEGTKINEDQLLDPEEAIVRYSKSVNAPDPKWDTGGANVPNNLYQSLDLTRREADQASGMNEVTRGTLDQQMSGRAILALQEQDETRMGHSAKLSEAEFSRWGQCVLFLVKNHYTEPRKYSIVGKGRQHAVFFFDKSQLGETSDVRCEPGSVLPLNRTAKQEFVMNMFKMGLLGPANSPEAQLKARRMMEFGQFDDAWDDDAQDEGVAEKENEAILQIAREMIDGGQDPQVILQIIMQNFAAMQFDNHLSHLKVHMRTFKSPGVRDNRIMALIFTEIMKDHVMWLQGGPVQADPNNTNPNSQNVDPNAVATNSPLNEGQQNSDQQILPSDGGN
ncbi:MAG: hypothetical protein PHV05_03800 [Candidatus Riflebacteria bacterium]|nr:hypothetical protein [Candidatus Riflebacteria bacterium]